MLKNTIIGLLTGYIVSGLAIWELNFIQRIITIYIVCVTVVAVISWVEDVLEKDVLDEED